MPATLDLGALLEYLDEEARNYERLFREHPDALKVKTDIGRVLDAQGLLHHIFAVEYRYAQRLNEEPITEWEQIPQEPTDELFQIGRLARAGIHRFIAGADEQKLSRTLTFQVGRLGEFTMTFRKCLAHALVHSTRHWAQMATTLRQAGYPQDWQHDFLFTSAME